MERGPPYFLPAKVIEHSAPTRPIHIAQKLGSTRPNDQQGQFDSEYSGRSTLNMEQSRNRYSGGDNIKILILCTVPPFVVVTFTFYKWDKKYLHMGTVRGYKNITMFGLTHNLAATSRRVSPREHRAPRDHRQTIPSWS